MYVDLKILTVLHCIGNTERTSNYTVVQWPTVSDPVHPGDSVTLQCSVLSDYKNKTSFDARTYYCAVATCGEILFGNGTKLELGMI